MINLKEHFGELLTYLSAALLLLNDVVRYADDHASGLGFILSLFVAIAGLTIQYKKAKYLKRLERLSCDQAKAIKDSVD